VFAAGTGPRNVYGEAFGLSTARNGNGPPRMAFQQRVESGYFEGSSIPPLPSFPQGQGQGGVTSRAGVRARTASTPNSPGRCLRKFPPVPPSSWRAGVNPDGR
jgi:hypothetical protein